MQQNQCHVAATWVQRHPGLDSPLDFADEGVYLLIFLHESACLTKDGPYHWEETALPHASIAQYLHWVGFGPQSQQARGKETNEEQVLELPLLLHGDCLEVLLDCAAARAGLGVRTLP